MNPDNNIVRISDNNDSFGFEEINLNQLRNIKSGLLSGGDYRLSKGVLWAFLGLIIAGAVVFYFFGDQELIFGKSSNVPTKQIVKKAEKPKVLTLPKQDSIKTDSLKSKANAEVQNSKK